MKISTVIATYNGEKYIAKQLESILMQSRKVDEVIIVDDCSSDNTVDIVRQFIYEKKLEENWAVIENDKNLGYKGNFKKSFENATGEIIILCDQDDIWEPSKVECFEEAFKKTGALAINTAFRFIDGNDKFISQEENNNNSNLLRRDYLPDEIAPISFVTILETNISPGCTMAITKELKDLFLGVTDGLLPHDWELNIIAALYDGLYFYNKKLTQYRMHGNNVIGLETDLKKIKFSSSVTYEKRCSNLSERIDLETFIHKLYKKGMVEETAYNDFKKLHVYDMLRYKCVVEKKWYVWFLMPLYALVIYRYHYIRYRGMVGDLVSVIRAIIN